MKNILIACFCLMSSISLAPAQERLDLILRNGTIVDGTGKAGYRADVGIRDGVIVQIGDLSKAQGKETIDAAGLVVAPGFIDVHTHADDVERKPLAENYVRMGVTSVVAGNCGSSTSNVADTLRRVRETGVAVNFATLVGHNTVRRAVMGTERRAPTAAELEKMKALVARAMSEGAVGLSTGLQYVPGTYAEPQEIVELAKVAAAAGGLYASHMRNEGTEIEQAVHETIAVGEKAGCRVQISHLKIDSPSHWGDSGKVLALIDAARQRGVLVEADQYAYSAGSAGLGIRFPSWALEGGREPIRQRLEDGATWAKIRGEMVKLLEERGFHDLSWCVVSSYRADPTLEGLSIQEIARKLKGDGSTDAQLEVAREMMLKGEPDMVYHFMSENDIARFMGHPQVAVASDSSLVTPGEGVPHPRSYGNNARILGHYVREAKTLSLEEAVRKMTSLPAGQFGFQRRGRIEKGFAADLALFDRNTVADLATYAKPHQYPVGIPDVIVNGIVVVRDGRHTGAKPGQMLRSGK
jgi:N-acyl-D-amino-acid deacylase